MSTSSSHGSSSGYRTFRQISRDRLLQEMLGSGESKWKVLVVDKFTVKVMSSSCNMADLTDEGVSLVEDISLKRQAFPSQDAVYFVQPLRENVIKVLSDMSGEKPLYKKAYVFFSSPIDWKDSELVSVIDGIKNDKGVRTRFGALNEMNLEYLAMDRQGFITDDERALEDLYGENMMNSSRREACLNLMATRIATVFASLGEFPVVRYRASKVDAFTLTTMRELIPTKLAAAVWNHLTEYKNGLKDFPQTETCELLILDRSVDLISPIIHEWTYDAMCRDLLSVHGNKYVHEVPSKTDGQPEKKDVLLEDHDSVWVELRHAHIGEAFERLNEKMQTFISKNKAAQMKHGSGNGGEMRTRDMQKVALALPEYREQMDKLSLHIGIAEKINEIVRETGLGDLGRLEQDLVFGDAGPKEVIKFLKTKQDVSRENKLRLMMICSAAYPEHCEGEKGLNLMQRAGLSHNDMIAVRNMRLLDDSSATEMNFPGCFSLNFSSSQKKKHRAIRKERKGEEQPWTHSRFYPMIEELIEKLNKGELPKNEYACMSNPSPVSAAHSVRTRRTSTWTCPRNSNSGYSSSSKRMGKRIFVFIIGGATRSELRVCHKLTEKFNREIILGSSSFDDPPQFITKLKMLKSEFDDLDI